MGLVAYELTHREFCMDLHDVTASVARLRFGRMGGLPPVHQPVTLIWAAQRAVKGEPRLSRWSDVRTEISDAISAVGGGSEPYIAIYPVLALAKSDLWELSASDQKPSATIARAVQWINEHDPHLGLSTEAHGALADEAALETFSLAAVSRLDEARARLVLDYFDIDVDLFRGFGDVPGIEVGATFVNREELAKRRVHRATQAGITGTKETGAESIVVSGGYEDDEDHGNVIIYTGHGGQGQNSRVQTADQDPEAVGKCRPHHEPPHRGSRPCCSRT